MRDVDGQISDMVVMSLMLPDTPIARKIARLHLLSDILANSSAPVSSAWKYRSAFESKLVPVFDHLNTIYQAFPGRMKADGFRRQVMAVVNLWETMLIFTPAGKPSSARERHLVLTLQLVIEDLTTRLVVGASVDDLEGVPMQEEELLAPVAEAARPRAGFKSIKTAVDEFDGAPMSVDGADVDGVAMPL